VDEGCFESEKWNMGESPELEWRLKLEMHFRLGGASEKPEPPNSTSSEGAGESLVPANF
jgi:hypothetical protein